MLEKEWFRPGGREGECSFLLAQKGTNGPGHLLLPLRGNSPRDAPRGVSPMSAFAQRVLKVAPPPGPPFAWDALLGAWYFRPAGKL